MHARNAMDGGMTWMSDEAYLDEVGPHRQIRQSQFTSAGARLHIHSFLDVTQTVFLPSKSRLDQKPSVMGWQIQFFHQRLDFKIVVLVAV
jgi:hypothetical protein